jgi:CxxC-x17-CxxC domain-containing protein
MQLMEFVDQELICVDCNQEFVFSAGEQAFFSDKGFAHVPRRCPACRAKRKFPPRKNGHPETKATCAACGLVTTVPFKPTQGRPVLCRLCFDKSKEPLQRAS